MLLLRPLDLVLVSLMIGGAAWTFQIKHEAELSSQRVAALNAAIEEERNRINLLKGDWALLDQPNVIQSVVERFNSALELQILDPAQVGSVAELPMRPIIQPEPEEMFASNPSQPKILDETATASTKPRPLSTSKREVEVVADDPVEVDEKAGIDSINDLIKSSQGGLY